MGYADSGAVAVDEVKVHALARRAVPLAEPTDADGSPENDERPQSHGADG